MDAIQQEESEAEHEKIQKVTIKVEKAVELERELRPVGPKPDEPPSPPTEFAVPPLEDQTFVPTASDYLRGQRLLEGGFPRLRATYQRIGFAAYRDAMLKLGGSFYLWDGALNLSVARLDPRTGESWEESVGSHLSRWPRDVTKHLKMALKDGRARYGARVTHAVLLPSARIDAALLSGLDQLLRKNGVDPGTVTSFFGAYELRSGRLYCVVLAASFTDATERDVSFAVDLSGAGS